MQLNAIYFLLGLVGLYFGAEWMVRGAARLARHFGVSPLVAGLTIVAFGTSAPELVVGVLAAASDQGALAVGNVVGSNVVNIALILGLAAVITPLHVEMRLLSREIPFMVGASVLLVLLAFDGSIGRLDGGVLLAIFAVYSVLVVRAARREPESIEQEYDEFEEAEHMVNHSPARAAGLTIVGLVVLVVGAHLLVDSAVFFARTFGISETTIGMTIVAIGTSLPELAVVFVAAVRKEADIALGNAVGSNIFNTLVIMGAASLTRPLPVAPSVLRFEMPAMVAVSAVLLPLAWSRRKLGRWEGALLAAAYIAFTWVLLERRT